MFSHDHGIYIEDREFLEKYSLQALSDVSTLADQALVLYFCRKGYAFPSFFTVPLVDVDTALWMALTNTERAQFDEERQVRMSEVDPYMHDPIVSGLMSLSSFSGPANRSYADVVEKLGAIPVEEFHREYPWLLVTLFEQSSIWVENDYCPFGLLEDLKTYLDGTDCEVELAGYGNEAGANCFVPAVFGGSGLDEDDVFALLLRDALPDEYIFHPSEDPYCEHVQIENPDAPYAGWGVVKYPERYDGIDRIVYLSSKPGGTDRTLLRAWMENGNLWGVIGTYSLCGWSSTFGSIIILNLDCNDRSVHFLRSRADEIVEDKYIGEPVPYEDIASFGYSLNPALYTHPDNPLGLPLVTLGELCEIDGDCRGRERMGTRLPYYDFTADFKRLCLNASHPRVDAYNSESSSALYHGPHVHISVNGGTAFVSHTPGSYHCQKIENIALKVRDNRVSEEYLAYVLTRDVSFMNFLLARPGEALLKRRIAIHEDRSEQDAFIRKFQGFLDDNVLSNNYYRIIWVDDSIDREKREKLSEVLEERQVGVRWLTSVLDREDGLEAALEGNTGPVDAVVVDAGVESAKGRLKGLRKALALCMKAEIPVYVCTDVDRETIADDLQDSEFGYLSDGRLFARNGMVYVGSLVAALRRELDGSHDIAAEMRTEFRKELQAAEWLDDHLKRSGVHLVSDLSAAILRPRDSLNIIRGILNSLYGVIIREIGNRSLEFLDRGALPSLLDDRTYRDSNDGITKRVFVIRGEVLPKTLARSLRLATDIANGASHKETSDESRGRLRVAEYFSGMESDNIAWAVIRIVMDLILYMQKVECRFDGYCEVFDPYKPEPVDWTGTVIQSARKEFCCETDTGVRVRMDIPKDSSGRPSIPEAGRRIRIRKLYREGKFVELYEWYVKRPDWEYI